MARRRIIAGNWKMNKTPSEAVALVNELKDLVVTMTLMLFTVYLQSISFLS